VNLCDDRRVIGVSCSEYRRDGAFADSSLFQRESSTDCREASHSSRPPCGGCFGRNPRSRPLAHCRRINALVLGSGMIGLLIIQVLRARGCRQIIAWT